MKALNIEAFAAEHRRRRLHLFLDFDGTLSPHHPDGRRSIILPKARSALAVLCAMPGVDVSVISGRPLEDLRPRVGIRGASYSGNHGLVISGGAGDFEHPQAQPLRRAFAAAAELIRPMVRNVPRVEVAHNGLSLSLNVGRVPRSRLAGIRGIVRSLHGKLSAMRLRWQQGNMGWDLVSEVGWTKGDALSHLMRVTPRALPIAIGDGVSDEEMFKRVAGFGAGIRVGRPRNTAAGWRVGGPREVSMLLTALARGNA